ncbi:MAG TPA: DUF2378 family protein [Aggregicoccus sp.]|nr:DUF2378 family protein [Aggregicoccus sp.]
MTSNPPPASPARVPAVVWESLFVRSLEVKGALRDELKAAGFDPERLEVSYPLSLFTHCVDLVRTHLYPQLSVPQVYWEMGRRTMQGFRSTLVGTVVTAAIPLLGPARYLKRIPEHAKVGGLKMDVTPVPVGEREYRLEFRRTQVTPEYAAGLIEVGMELAKVKPSIEPRRIDAEGFDLIIHW